MNVLRYRKRPIEIEAMQLPADPTHEENDALHDFLGDAWWASDRDGISVRTLEGTMYAQPGDFIIRGIRGEFYPCKPDIFAETYDLVTDEKKEKP